MLGLPWFICVTAVVTLCSIGGVYIIAQHVGLTDEQAEPMALTAFLVGSATFISQMAVWIYICLQ